MTTSSAPMSTSSPPRQRSRSMKPSASRPMTDASPTTATRSPGVSASTGQPKPSRIFKDRIERHQWLIQQVQTGRYLGTVRNGEIIWVDHPLDALRHCQMEVASNNYWKLKEFYKLTEDIRLEPVMFYAHTSSPTQWFTDYD